MDYKLTVLKHPMKGRQHSFWYEGAIAQIKLGSRTYEALACGEIEIRRRRDNARMQWEDIAREAKDDAGLDKLVGSEDDDTGTYYHVQGSWFEVVDADTLSGSSDVFSYDDAIMALQQEAVLSNKLFAPDM